MKRRRSRFALVGVLVLSVTMGLLVGGVADAKKGKSKPKNTVTVTKTNVPIAQGPTVFPGPETVLTNVPLFVPRKQFKGKSVGLVELTVQLTGPASDGVLEGSLQTYSLALTAPNGRTLLLPSPGQSNSTTVGPLRITPNSPLETCFQAPPPAVQPPPPCNPDTGAVGPTFVGTVGDSDLALFYGIKMAGTWTLKVFDFDGADTGPTTLSSVKLEVRAAKPIV